MHLLSKPEHEDMDLAKLTKLSLLSTLGMLGGVAGIRIALFLLNAYDIAPQLLTAFIMILICFAFIASFGVINYKTDTMLKRHLRDEMEKNQNRSNEND